MRHAFIVVALLPLMATLAPGQDSSPSAERSGRAELDGAHKGKPLRTTLPADTKRLQDLSLILGRPTDKSVTVSVLSAEPREGYIEYGTASGIYTGKTGLTPLPAGTPVEVLIDKLDPRHAGAGGKVTAP